MSDRRILSRFILLILILLFLLVALTKIWPSDRYPGYALISYTPSPFLLAAGILILFLTRRKKFKLLSLFSMVLILLTLFYVARENKHLFRFTRKMPPDVASIRVLHWNVWQGNMGPENVAREIGKQRPDIICLNEPRLKGKFEIPPYSRLIGGRWHQVIRQNLLILSRYPAVELKGFWWHGMQTLHVKVLSEKPFTLLLVDMRSSPLLFRGSILEELSYNMEEWEPHPDLVVGDFNTPAGSFSFQNTIEKHYTDSYQIAGTGLAYTWMSWFPFMKIDFIFARNPKSVLRHRTGFTVLSDHRWQWIDYQQVN